MKVRFLQDYQGQYTGPHFYREGQVVELDDSTATLLIADKRAVEVEAEPKTTGRKPRAKKGESS